LNAAVSYRVEVADVHAHLFRVSLELPRPTADVRLELPVWIPGSYMVREFARHLSGIEATQGGVRRDVEALDKTSWRVRCDGAAPLVVSWLAYAFDPSVRAAYLDARRGFFNGTSLLLRVVGREAAPHRLALGALPHGWAVATALRDDARGGYAATDYDELVDHPVMLGAFWRGRFEARGVTHELAVEGALPGFDGERLLADTRAIVETQMAFWHGKAGKPPFDRYVFMLNAVDDGYGGLEHRASTALLAARRDLPRVGNGEPGDGYAGLLGLVSHEYFHTWNVKRLKPRELARVDYARENHTRLLWFFEGLTSYYDDLLLLRAGRIDTARYCKLLAKALNGVLATPGRFVQSVAQASFDAWTKYYRPDENTPNATVNYYGKGALVGLALDLTLRASGRGTLDEVMRLLWSGSGGGPIDESDIARALLQVGGRAFDRELAAWVHGTDELPLQPLLERAGIAWSTESPGAALRLGLRVAESALSGVSVKQVLRGGLAERAGLAAGDELIAANGWRLRRLDDVLAAAQPGMPVELLAARDQRLYTARLDLEPAGGGMVALAPAGAPSASALALRREWLGH
jgi:predicted metalloprotease with PDZ domain